MATDKEERMARSSTSFKRGHKPMGGRPKGSLNRTTIEIREFARRLIEDPEYQAGLWQRVTEGKAPQMEMLLFKYAYGQPVERHEVNAEVRGASLSRSGPMASAPARENHLDRDLIIHGGVVTKDGAERIRRLTDSIIPILEAGRKALAAAGKLPPGVTPPPSTPEKLSPDQT
jgi:hypothetical protein